MSKRPTGHVVTEIYSQHDDGPYSCGAAIAAMPSDPAARQHALALAAFAALRQLAIDGNGMPDHVARRIRLLLSGLEGSEDAGLLREDAGLRVDACR